MSQFALEPVSDSDDSDGLGIHSSRSILLYPEATQAVEADIKLYLRSNATEVSLRVTNVIVSSNKETQIGSSFGKADLPYEQGDKILIPRGVCSGNVPSSSLVLHPPLHGVSSHDTSNIRRVEIHAPNKDVRCVNGSEAGA